MKWDIGLNIGIYFSIGWCPTNQIKYVRLVGHQPIGCPFIYFMHFLSIKPIQYDAGIWDETGEWFLLEILYRDAYIFLL